MDKMGYFIILLLFFIFGQSCRTVFVSIDHFSRMIIFLVGEPNLL